MQKAKKGFVFSKFKQRYIALKILYFGWDCDGLAAQANSENTIEHHLFEALTKTCLIKSRDTCRYNRCGRTDKGVSSHGQVVNLSIRSNLVDETDPENIGLYTPENYDNSSVGSEDNREEINYVNILNRVLPDHIKVIAWAPVKATFSSRFNCQSRSYSYIFPKGDLSLDSMREALKYLIGEHDFRNLCSFDLKNGVTNHRRTILDAQVRHLAALGAQKTGPYCFCEVVIKGQAFLYHQIRCIMTVLFLVGTKQEAPEIVRDLLDIDKCPAQPNYNRASPLPLCLFDCKYNADELPLGWLYDHQAIINTFKQLKKLWFVYKTKSLMIERVLLDFEATIRSSGHGLPQDLDCWKDFGLAYDNMSNQKYVPLLKRPCDGTLESKLETLDRKRKVPDDEKEEKRPRDEV